MKKSFEVKRRNFVAKDLLTSRAFRPKIELNKKKVLKKFDIRKEYY